MLIEPINIKKISSLLLVAFISYSNTLHTQTTSYIDYQSPFHPTLSDGPMVVSQNELSSDVGIEIIKSGGNAVDAAVAVGFSLAVTLPRAGNLGGGGFMLIYLKEQNEILAIDYRGQSPSELEGNQIFGVELPKDYDQANRDIVRYGYKASTIPGTVSGLLLAHAQFGKLPLDEVMKPAIDQAVKGINVSFDLEQAIASAPQLSWDDESRGIYFNDGKPLQEGSIMQRPDLAKTMTLSPTSILVEPVGNITDLFLITAPIATPSGNGLLLSGSPIKIEDSIASNSITSASPSLRL